MFIGQQIKEIKCGGNHSYVQTENNEHYLFGLNTENQCITSDTDTREDVLLPHSINNIVKNICNNEKNIETVNLGGWNTKIILL